MGVKLIHDGVFEQFEDNLYDEPEEGESQKVKEKLEVAKERLKACKKFDSTLVEWKKL